jgi:hypothetical protein
MRFVKLSRVRGIEVVMRRDVSGIREQGIGIHVWRLADRQYALVRHRLPCSLSKLATKLVPRPIAAPQNVHWRRCRGILLIVRRQDPQQTRIDSATDSAAQYADRLNVLLRTSQRPESSDMTIPTYSPLGQVG